MIKVEDIFVSNWQPEFTQAGIAFISQALLQPVNHLIEASADDLREQVLQIGLELGFRQLLVEKNVPFELVAPVYFQKAEQYPRVELGGRKCILIPQLVSRRKKIRQLRQDHRQLLAERLPNLPAVVPERSNKRDLILFSTVTGLVTRSIQDTARAAEAGQPLHLIYPFPKHWSLPQTWQAMKATAIKTDQEDVQTCTVAGLDGQRGPLQTTKELPGRVRTPIEQKFYALRFISTRQLVKGGMGISCQKFEAPLLIAAHQWVNLWIYGLQTYWLGYLTVEEYLDQGAGLAANQLHPIADLLTRARQWHEKKG